MATARPAHLDRPVDPGRDHILGGRDADITLVEYGGYTCPFCHAAHEVLANLRDRFGDSMRYVFRHRPLQNSETGRHAAVLAEYVAATSGEFWPVHDALMRRGPEFSTNALHEIARESGIVPDTGSAEWAAAAGRVDADAQSARHSGAMGTPTFFINGRRYEGPWDEGALAEAMIGSLGHRIHTASLDFARWAPSTGVLLLMMTVLAVLLTNSPAGPEFLAWWQTPASLRAGDRGLSMPIVNWVNDGLLSLFFLVVGLEIKRELTIGRLATLRAAALPLAGAAGGMLLPALFYLAVIPSGPLAAGWGVTIATDTAFAVALLALLGDRVPVELRVFLTAAVIVDDLVVILLIAVFYSDGMDPGWLLAAAGVTAGLAALNHWNIFRVLPYALLGLILWLCLHEAGVHGTLAGVIVALTTPTRPPPNMHALLGQAQMVVVAEAEAEADAGGEMIMRHGLSEPALRAMDAIHDRIESPAAKILRTAEPWSSYLVLPLFAFANAGVVLSADVVAAHGTLLLAIVLGLVVGKPLGILGASWLAVRAGIAIKPAAYTWRQLAGAGALGGIGFTMSLFIAGQAFPVAADFAAAKIAIFIASLLAAAVGVLVLWRRATPPAPG